MQLAGRRQRVELELISAILSEPRKGVKLAMASGVTHAGQFEEEDLRWIFAAAVMQRRKGKLAVLRAARVGLKHAGFWDERVVRTERGYSWSDANLAALASAYPGPGAAATLAKELVEIDYRQSESRRCWKRM